MKGIILAGGSGKRLYPLTLSINKHLLPIYNKPMIYYPLSLMMIAKIKKVLIITKEEDISNFKKILSNGERFGINIKYAIQKKPNGIGEAFSIGKKFIGNDDIFLALGDNIIFGDGLSELLRNSKKIIKNDKKAVIFGYPVNNPSQFGIININKREKVINIKEKPKKTESNLAAIGIYFFPNSVMSFSNKIKKSKRGELEITDINNIFIKKKKIKVIKLGRGFVWYDAGNPENLLDISNIIQRIESRNNLKIACLEEIAFKNKWIKKELLKKNFKFNNNTGIKYLSKL